jgi:cell division protein FtsZ
MAKKRKKTKKRRKTAKSKKEDVPVHKIKVKVVGVGGGAGSIINDIAVRQKRTKFYVADTDFSRLSKFKNKKRMEIIDFGGKTTKGMGTGMDVSLGREAAEIHKEVVKKALDGSDLCIFVSCLGGGTGSGAMPVFARIAQELEILSFGVFTLPFGFEREKKLKTAKTSLNRMKPFLNAMAIIPNQRIFELTNDKMPIKKALSSINRTMGASLEGLIEMIYGPGLINIDFADLDTILRGAEPLSYLTRAKSGGKERVKDVLKKLMTDPLYPYDFSSADRILFNIVAPHNLSLSEVAEVSEAIAKNVKREDSKVIFGVDLTQGKNELDVTLLAVGCEKEDLFTGGDGEEDIEVQQRLPIMEEKTEEKREIVVKEQYRKREDQYKDAGGVEQGKKEKEKEIKVRKNALEVHKDLEEIEKELSRREKKWEKPAFLRRGK